MEAFWRKRNDHFKKTDNKRKEKRLHFSLLMSFLFLASSLFKRGTLRKHLQPLITSLLNVHSFPPSEYCLCSLLFFKLITYPYCRKFWSSTFSPSLSLTLRIYSTLLYLYTQKMVYSECLIQAFFLDWMEYILNMIYFSNGKNVMNINVYSDWASGYIEKRVWNGKKNWRWNKLPIKFSLFVEGWMF